jgi:hypothetical protein
MPLPAIKVPTGRKQEKPKVGAEELITKKNRAFSEMNRLHAQLPLLATDEARRLYAVKILELDRETQRCWKAIDHFNATGEIKEAIISGKEEAPPFDPSDYDALELARLITIGKAYVSKAKKEGYPQEKVDSRSSQIKEIEEYLATIKK